MTNYLFNSQNANTASNEIVTICYPVCGLGKTVPSGHDNCTIDKGNNHDAYVGHPGRNYQRLVDETKKVFMGKSPVGFFNLWKLRLHFDSSS